MTVTRYTPQVGDRIRLIHWQSRPYAVVTAVGEQVLLARTPEGFEETYSLDLPWQRVNGWSM